MTMSMTIDKHLGQEPEPPMRRKAPETRVLNDIVLGGAHVNKIYAKTPDMAEQALQEMFGMAKYVPPLESTSIRESVLESSAVRQRGSLAMVRVYIYIYMYIYIYTHPTLTALPSSKLRSVWHD